MRGDNMYTTNPYFIVISQSTHTHTNQPLYLQGVVIAYKAEGCPDTEPGASYDPDATVADNGDEDDDEKPRFRNARRTPALYKIKYDAPSSFVAGAANDEDNDQSPPPTYLEDLTLTELEPALAAARKRLTSSIPVRDLQSCGKQVVAYRATLDKRGEEALDMMISGLDDEGRDVDKLEGELRFVVCWLMLWL